MTELHAVLRRCCGDESSWGAFVTERLGANDADQLRSLLTAVVPLAKYWVDYCDGQRARGSAPKRHPKVSRVIDAIGRPQYEYDNARDLFNQLPYIGELYGLTIRLDDEDPDQAEWDDCESGKCGDFRFRTFQDWLWDSRRAYHASA